MNHLDIAAVAFDCYGTLVDFGDEAFTRAYETICVEQGIPIDGRTFFDKWMEVWRRLARDGLSSDGGSVGVEANRPGPLSAAEPVPPHPEHHTPSAGRNRALSGPVPEFRPYSDEWPEHFAICFEELGVRGDPQKAHNRLVELLAAAPAYEESKPVVEAVRRQLPVALLSNADDDFLQPCLARNGLEFPVVVSSQTARAYKPHEAIFRTLSEKLGLPPERILYVGDSPLADVTGAKHAGLRAAWVNRRPRDQRPINRSLEMAGGGDAESQTGVRLRLQPDIEIDSLTRLLDILPEISSLARP